ncbi:unnamed protein product [marine sediment metagenome]|uniref:Nucleotide-diphospho-sugar transferase domain-containing protein n=1 Tax=marine sediment metagenome TaxID=412755 RepID=X0T5H4_9ZZZZ
MKRGVLYVAFGDNARLEVISSVASLWQYNDLDVTVVCDSPVDLNGAEFVRFEGSGDPLRRSRLAKLSLNLLVRDKWDCFLYLDADTRVRGDLSSGFDLLEDGWDIALTPSVHQVGEGAGLMHHVGEDEREVTLSEYINPQPLALQAGVMFVKCNHRTDKLFALWRSEWRKWFGQDQAALLRALEAAPAKVWMLGRPWNTGDRNDALIEHLFGRAR